MKTYVITFINQLGDKYFFYPKCNSVADSFKKAKLEAERASDSHNSWVMLSSELFDIKIHGRD